MPSYVLQMNRCFPETLSSSEGCPHSAITSETGWFCHDAITEFMAWLVHPAAKASARSIKVNLRLKRNLCITCLVNSGMLSNAAFSLFGPASANGS